MYSFTTASKYICMKLCINNGKMYSITLSTHFYKKKIKPITSKRDICVGDSECKWMTHKTLNKYSIIKKTTI